MTSKNKNTSRGYFYACFKGYVGRVLENNLRQKIIFKTNNSLKRFLGGTTALESVVFCYRRSFLTVHRFPASFA